MLIFSWKRRLSYRWQPEIIRVVSKDKQRDNSVTLPSHGNYVQGVAWDPLNKFVATQSADRSVRVHKVSARPVDLPATDRSPSCCTERTRW